MTEIINFNNAMNARRAEELVHKIATVCSAVKFTTHALERMDLRDISFADVMRVLQKGSVEDPPKARKNHGEWSVKIVRHHRGCRDIGVVTLIIREEKLLIKTVEWEDL